MIFDKYLGRWKGSLDIPGKGTDKVPDKDILLVKSSKYRWHILR